MKYKSQNNRRSYLPPPAPEGDGRVMVEMGLTPLAYEIFQDIGGAAAIEDFLLEIHQEMLAAEESNKELYDYHHI